jgi:ankyrin repeat protein
MFTPLHSAAQQGHVMIVKLLLENGASPNKTNKVDNDPYLIVFLILNFVSSSME